jgi:multidrug resistance efflux pump
MNGSVLLPTSSRYLVSTYLKSWRDKRLKWGCMVVEQITIPKGYGAWRSPIANGVMLLVSVALLAWAWEFFRTRSTSVVSVDAVVNGTIVDLKAPEEGILTTVANRTGDQITAGMPMFTVRNDRLNELPMQESKSRLNQTRADLARAQERVDRLVTLATSASVDDIAQVELVKSDTSVRVQQLDAEIAAVRARMNLSQVQIDRMSGLVKEGAVPKATLDVPQAEIAQRIQEIKALEAQIEALRVSDDAAKQGLSISKTRSNYDPKIRVQELQIQIADGRAEIASLKQKIRDGEMELTQAKSDLKQRQQVMVNAPLSGVLWKMMAQEGKFVQRGEVLAQVADCKTRWVDALVDEGEVNALQVGMSADIRLTGAKEGTLLRGKVQTIRSGVGRLSAGQEVATPIAPNLPRYSQVRVELDPTQAVSVDDSGTGNLCSIGYTGRVTFQLPEKAKTPGLLGWLPKR